VDKKKSTVVGVELKHIRGKLEGERLQQLADNAVIVAAGRMKRIEYIFSTPQAAIENKDIFKPYIDKNPANFKVFYIDTHGNKQPFNF
jgi:hypothetical protein